MTSPCSELHLFKILKEFEESRLPLDVFLSHYFRSHKAVGAKDRRFICDTIYDLVRWRGLLDHLCAKPPSWEMRYLFHKSHALAPFQQDETIPPHIRSS